MIHRVLGSWLLAWAIFPLWTSAQGIQVFKGFKITGNLGISGEAYTASGIENRRAPFLFRATGAASFDLFGLASGINLIYSTDESKVRQSINRVMFNTRYKTVALSAGGIVPSLTKYTLNGITLYGGAIQFTPKKFDAVLTGGRSKRATSGTTEDFFRGLSFDQTLIGTKLGYGKQGQTYFHLAGLYGNDQGSGGTATNPIPILPAQNYVIAPQFGLNLFKGKVKLEGSLTGSVYSRNGENPRTNTRDAAFFGLVPLNDNTQLAYAGDGLFQLNFKKFRLQSNYERIEQGYQTMGLLQLRDDQEQWKISPQFKFLKNKVQLKLNYQDRRNNLNKTRTTTTHRRQGNAQATFQPTSKLSVQVGYDQSENKGTNTKTNLVSNQVSKTISLNPSLSLTQGETNHSFTVSSSYQTLQDYRPKLLNTTTNANVTTNYGLTLPSKQSLTASGNWLLSKVGTAETTGLGAQLGLGQQFFKDRLALNLGFTWTSNKTADTATALSLEGRQLGLTFSAGWKLKIGDVLQFGLRGMNSQQTGGETAQRFRELQGTMQLNHNF